MNSSLSFVYRTHDPSLNTWLFSVFQYWFQYYDFVVAPLLSFLWLILFDDISVNEISDLTSSSSKNESLGLDNSTFTFDPNILKSTLMLQHNGGTTMKGLWHWRVIRATNLVTCWVKASPNWVNLATLCWTWSIFKGNCVHGSATSH